MLFKQLKRCSRFMIAYLFVQLLVCATIEAESVSSFKAQKAQLEKSLFGFKFPDIKLPNISFPVPGLPSLNIPGLPNITLPNITLPQVQNVSLSPASNTTVSPVQNITVTPVQNITVSPVQNITEPPVQNITVSPVQNITVPPIQNITVPPVQNITVPPIQNITTPQVSNITLPQVSNITEPFIGVPNISLPLPNISLPIPQFPNISIPSWPNISLPNISFPLPSLPNISLPNITFPLPQLPNITLPSRPNITLPTRPSPPPVTPTPTVPAPNFLQQIGQFIGQIFSNIGWFLGSLIGIRPASNVVSQSSLQKAAFQQTNNDLFGQLANNLFQGYQTTFNQLIKQMERPSGPNMNQVQRLVNRLQGMVHQTSFYGGYLVDMVKTQPLSTAQQLSFQFSQMLSNFSDLSNFCSLFSSSVIAPVIVPLFQTLVEAASDIEQSLGDCDESRQEICQLISQQVENAISQMQACVGN